MRDCIERYMVGRMMASRRVASMAGLSSISIMAEELGEAQREPTILEPSYMISGQMISNKVKSQIYVFHA